MKNIFFDKWGMLRGVWFFVIVILCASAFIVGCAYTNMLVSRYKCTVYSEMTQRETAFRGATCFVNQNGRFIPREELELRAITNEAK